ncbi:DHA2 family efflux MFS transporter permease subunit [Paenibacillus caui]|uniref:DHA2 family efflux MFS transporter permease subunit n=1 Tax=Paenibacillus caui TaxID=2873927 RepID=UPI001CA9812B|nr:DHA2 family efflux MFS transporter permease subunit [Paenibacillus caui]
MNDAQIQSSPKRWWILGALAISLFTVGLDMTVLNLALPALASDLHATTSQLQWFANAYNLVLAAALLPAGMLGDRLGRKKLLLMALLLFGGASLVCAYAETSEILIAARAALGLGAAFLMPLSMSLLPILFSGEERPKAIRVWVTATAVGMPLGPILGGWLLKHYWWGSVFLINVPIIIIALIAMIWLLPETRSAEKAPADLPGILTSSLGLTAITYGVTEAGEKGWGDAVTLSWIIAGLLLLAIFVFWQRNARHPLVNLSLFREARFTWGSILATLVNFSLFGVLFGLPLFFQAVNGVDAQATGLRILPMIGGLMVGAQLSGKLIKLTGDKMIIVLGFLLMAAGLFLGGFTEASGSYGYAAVWIAIIGTGLGFALPSAMDAALGVLAVERNGVGSALIMALRQVGGTIGVALLGSLLNSVYHRQLDVGGLPPQAAEAVRDNVATGVQVARQMNNAPLLESVRSAFTNGLDVMLWACAGIAAFGVIATLLFLPRMKRTYVQTINSTNEA